MVAKEEWSLSRGPKYRLLTYGLRKATMDQCSLTLGKSYEKHGGRVFDESCFKQTAEIAHVDTQEYHHLTVTSQQN